jgi:hypothetical protein
MHGVQTQRAVRARRAPELAVERAGVADLARRHARRVRVPALTCAKRLRDAPRRRRRVRLARLARCCIGRARARRVRPSPAVRTRGTTRHIFVLASDAGNTRTPVRAGGPREAGRGDTRIHTRAPGRRRRPRGARSTHIR